MKSVSERYNVTSEEVSGLSMYEIWFDFPKITLRTVLPMVLPILIVFGAIGVTVIDTVTSFTVNEYLRLTVITALFGLSISLFRYSGYMFPFYTLQSDGEDDAITAAQELLVILVLICVSVIIAVANIVISTVSYYRVVITGTVPEETWVFFFMAQPLLLGVLIPAVILRGVLLNTKYIDLHDVK